MRCVEFYSGIGGFATAAARLNWQVVRAYEINRHAAEVYAGNFPHQVDIRTIESITHAELAALNADLWWMSPPCQPFTLRGKRRDIADSRSSSLINLIQRIELLRPPLLALENVPGFRDSMVARRLRLTLASAEYAWQEILTCPSELGIPNRRARYYLIATRADPLRPFAPAKTTTHLAEHLEEAVPRNLDVDAALLSTYRAAIDIVRSEDPLAVTSCFTAAYGKSPVRSGSYLQQQGRVRRFAPREVASLLGFPRSYRLPMGINSRTAWKLLGNSLSIPVVVNLLNCLPSA